MAINRAASDVTCLQYEARFRPSRTTKAGATGQQHNFPLTELEFVSGMIRFAAGGNTPLEPHLVSGWKSRGCAFSSELGFILQTTIVARVCWDRWKILIDGKSFLLEWGQHPWGKH